MNRPSSLPVDELLVWKCQRLIETMNRSERARVHRLLIAQSKTAKDKLVTDNTNLVSVRLSRDDFVSVINIVEDENIEVSAFLRKLIQRSLKEKQ